jgi:hypothetical protein
MSLACMLSKCLDIQVGGWGLGVRMCAKAHKCMRGVPARMTCASLVQGAQNTLSAIFYSAAYMQFLGLAECAKTMQRLPVFWKQKFKLFYPGAVCFCVLFTPSVCVYICLECQCQPRLQHRFCCVVHLRNDIANIFLSRPHALVQLAQALMLQVRLFSRDGCVGTFTHARLHPPGG